MWPRGYPGCRPHAEAIANGDNIINVLPAVKQIEKLADLMGLRPLSQLMTWAMK